MTVVEEEDLDSDIGMPRGEIDKFMKLQELCVTLLSKHENMDLRPTLGVFAWVNLGIN